MLLFNNNAVYSMFFHAFSYCALIFLVRSTTLSQCIETLVRINIRARFSDFCIFYPRKSMTVSVSAVRANIFRIFGLTTIISCSIILVIKEMGFHRVGIIPDRTCSFLFLFLTHHTNTFFPKMHV